MFATKPNAMAAAESQNPVVEFFTMKKETVVKRKVSPEFLKKFAGYTEEREAHLDLDIKGEKARKIAEWAEYIKYLSVEKRTEALCIPVAEFTRMMVKPGTPIKASITYVTATLKKFISSIKNN